MRAIFGSMLPFTPLAAADVFAYDAEPAVGDIVRVRIA